MSWKSVLKKTIPALASTVVKHPILSAATYVLADDVVQFAYGNAEAAARAATAQYLGYEHSLERAADEAVAVRNAVDPLYTFLNEESIRSSTRKRLERAKPFRVGGI